MVTILCIKENVLTETERLKLFIQHLIYTVIYINTYKYLIEFGVVFLLEEFKGELVSLIGSEKILDDPKTLEEYSRDHSSQPPRKPFLVVKAKNAEDVKKVIQLANKYCVPVVPRSSHVGFYGAAIPEELAVVLDLSGMDKILDVDERNRWVRFEPGVTWGKLQEELAKRNLMALIPLLPHPAKSALTSHLEREPPLIPKQEYQEPLISLEMVMPTGEIFRTGPAAAPATKLKVHSPFGPGPIEWRKLFMGAQGTFGVATWVTVKVEYLPKIQKLYFIPFNGLEEVVEATYAIQHRAIGHEYFILNDLNMAILASEKWPEDFNRLRGVMPRFTVVLCIAGGRRLPEEKIAYEEEALFEEASRHGFKPVSTLPNTKALGKRFLNLIRKPWPKDKPYWKFLYKGMSRDIFFHTTLDKTPRYLKTLFDLAEDYRYPVHDIGVYIQPMELGRVCHCEFNLYLNPENAEEVRLVDDLFKEASEKLISMGAFFSRPYGVWARMVYSRCAHYHSALRKLKKIFDPNNIMNPGKLNL